MAPLKWSKSADVSDSPDAVFEWMTDFQPDDHARPAFVKGSGAKKTYTSHASKRTVLARTGNHVTIHDDWGGRHFEMELDLVPLDRTVKMIGPFGYSAVWKAVPNGDGTRLEANVALDVKGFFRFIMKLFQKRFFRELDQDFAGHVADLKDSLKIA
jgi:hypothetical protein